MVAGAAIHTSDENHSFDFFDKNSFIYSFTTVAIFMSGNEFQGNIVFEVISLGFSVLVVLLFWCDGWLI